MREDDSKLREILKSAMLPVADAELQRDLWPRMLQRLDAPPTGVSRLDWTLIGLLLLMLFIFPEAIPGLMYLL